MAILFVLVINCMFYSSLVRGLVSEACWGFLFKLSIFICHWHSKKVIMLFRPPPTHFAHLVGYDLAVAEVPLWPRPLWTFPPVTCSGLRVRGLPRARVFVAAVTVGAVAMALGLPGPPRAPKPLPWIHAPSGGPACSLRRSCCCASAHAVPFKHADSL